MSSTTMTCAQSSGSPAEIATEGHSAAVAAPRFSDAETADIKECVGSLSPEWVVDFMGAKDGAFAFVGPRHLAPREGAPGRYFLRSA